MAFELTRVVVSEIAIWTFKMKEFVHMVLWITESHLVKAIPPTIAYTAPQISMCATMVDHFIDRDLTGTVGKMILQTAHIITRSGLLEWTKRTTASLITVGWTRLSHLFWAIVDFLNIVVAFALAL